MTRLDKLLSRVMLQSEAIRDRVTGNAEKVLGRVPSGNGLQITAVGDFSEPWKNDAEEIAAIRTPGTWSPSKIDFIAVATKSRTAAGRRTVPVIGSSQAFVQLIMQQNPASIGRLNIITHGSSRHIGLYGMVTPGEVSFTEVLDMDVLRDLKITGFKYRKGKNSNIDGQWNELLSRFADNAVMVIYACNAGLSPSFMQDLADILNIRVQGFKKEIQYWYPEHALKNGRVNRNLLTLDGKLDFVDLIPGVDLSPKVKRSAP